jgi:gliding motility-associated-like protein
MLDYVDTNYNLNKIVCRVRDTMNSKVDRPTIKFDPPVVVSCEGKSTKVSVGVVGMNQNLFNYTWDTTQHGKVKANYLNPNQVITPANEGYHYVTVSSVDNPNCFNVDSVYVYIQSLSTMPNIGGTAFLCPGDSLTLSIPNDVGYKNPQWKYNGSLIDQGYSIKVSSPGQYSMIVDSGACTNNSDVKEIIIRNIQTATLVNKDHTICEGDSAIVMYTQGDNVANPVWNVGLTTPVIKVTQPGKYFLVKPRDQYGCIMTMKDTATVKLIDNPDFKLLDDTICLNINQKLLIQPVPFDPSAKYKWYPDGRYLSYMEVYTEGEICVTRTKGTCSKTVCAKIIKDTSGGIDLGKSKAICCDEVLTLNGNPDGKKYTGYKWSTGENSQVIYTKPNVSGLYIVEAIKPNGCKDTGSIFIDSKCGQVRAKPEKASIFLGQTNNIIGEHLGVNASNIIYRWIPSDKDNDIDKGNTLNPVAKPRDTGDVEYVLVMTVIDSNYMPPKPYCIENEVVRFKVAPNKLDTVNVFSPDGDGINDYIYPRIQGIVELKEFKVYNRYGQLLHDDPKKPWDGKYKNEYQPVGVYIALISYELNEPKKDRVTKYDKVPITLVR